MKIVATWLWPGERTEDEKYVASVIPYFLTILKNRERKFNSTSLWKEWLIHFTIEEAVNLFFILHSRYNVQSKKLTKKNHFSF